MGVGFWIDVAVIVIIVVLAVIGLGRGLLDSVLSLFGTGLSFAISVWLAKPAANLLLKVVDTNTFFREKLVAIVGGEEVTFFGAVFTVDKVAAFCTILLTIVILFLLLKLVIFLLAKLFESATANNTALSGLNRLFGLLFGLAKGVLTVALLLAMCSLIAKIPGLTVVEEYISSSTVTNYGYKYIVEFVEDNVTADTINSIVDGLTA